MCRTLSEISTGGLNKFSYQSVAGHRYFSGVTTPFTYNRWDADKHQSCICDPGHGGYDCSEQLCPRGSDPLTQGSRFCGGAECTWEIQKFMLQTAGATTLRLSFEDSFNNTAYADVEVSVNTQNNGFIAESLRATQLPGPTTVAGAMADAMRGIPGGLFQRIEIYPLAGDSTDDSRIYFITFVGLAGDQNLLKISKIAGQGGLASPVTRFAKGNREEIECSGRGLCTRSSGLCACFSGYTGESCMWCV